MARIELKYCTIRMRDGLSGSGAAANTTAPATGDTTLTLGTVALNSLRPGIVPIGARVRVAGETTPIDHVVTARVNGTGAGTDEKQSITVTNATGGSFRLLWGGDETVEIGYNATPAQVQAALTALQSVRAASNLVVTGTPGAYVVEFEGDLGNTPQALLDTDISNLIGTNPSVVVAETQLGVLPTSGNTTTSITFAPALGPGTYTTTAALTFKPQQINIKIGEGNLTYTEHRDYTYLLDRGWLDTVREPKDVPMDVKLDAVYEHITSDTGELVCPMDALKGVNSAAEWVSSSPDLCEPYCVDLLVEYDPPCAAVNRETNVFPMFRAETREVNYNAATIVLTGKCNVREPVTYRGAACDNV